MRDIGEAMMEAYEEQIWRDRVDIALHEIRVISERITKKIKRLFP